jgi:hypothetical protein
MKKFMFVLMVVFFVGQCMAYTVEGKVIDGITGLPVILPGTTVNLTGPNGCSDSTTASTIDGSFRLQCSHDMGGTTVYVTAKTADGRNGQVSINVGQNGVYNYQKVPVYFTVEPIPSLQIPTMPANWTGSPGPSEFISSFEIQATGAPIQIQNAQINIFFNGAIQNVNNVVPTTATSSFSYSTPVPGQLVVNAEFNPPKDVPDFPAESFFDVFFEVEVPESGALLGNVTIQEAVFEDEGGLQLSAIPSLTQNLVGDYEYPSPYFLVDSLDEWQSKLDAEWPDVHIKGLTLVQGEDYLLKLFEDFVEGEPYSPIEPALPDFIPPELYVYEGDEADPDMPDDPGLVMKWGDDTTPDG